MNETNLYEEYVVNEAKLKELTEKKDEIRKKILEEMVTAGEKKITTAFGCFSQSPLKKWTYPESVQEAKEEYDAAKAEAENNGTATYTETPSLRFTPAKL